MQQRLALLLIFSHVGFLFAANPPTPSSWTNGSGDGFWTNASNWTTGIAPVATSSIAHLINGDGASPTITINGSTTVGTILIDLGTPYTVNNSGPALEFNTSSGSAAIDVTSTNGSANHIINAEINLYAPLVVTQNSNTPLTITGVIANPSSPQTLTKEGTGPLLLSNSLSNTYTGGTIINAGTLTVSSATDNQLGGDVTIGTATLAFDNSAPLSSTRNYILNGSAVINASDPDPVSLSAPGVISGAGSLEKVGSATLILAGTNTYTGGTIISAGEVQVSNDNNLGATTAPLHIGTAALVTTSSITSSRSGTFTGSPSGIDTNSSANTASFSGNFSGVGALQIQGGGTVVFTGTNSYQGGTTVTASSTLSGNTNGVQGNIILDGPNTLLKFTQTFDGTYGGVISDGAAGIKQLTKEGTGKVTFTGSSPSFTGTTTVSAGSLIVNGSIANSPVNVFVGALLGGTGTVGPTTNAGILSPGNSIGTLTINGPLILTNSSTVVIETSPLTSDLISVTGTAFIDGNLTVTFEPGFYGLGTTYTIVTASGGFPAAPGFDLNTIDISSNFTPTLIYSGNNLLLSVTTLQPFFEFPYSNQNTQAVGENINALTQGGQLTSSLTNAIQSLVGDSFSSVNAVLDEMHPAPYSAFTEFQAESGGQLISLFHRPAYLSCGYQRDNRLWLEPFGNTLTVKNHGIQVGFQANSGGIALGGDCQYSEHVALGWGGAWNFTRLNWRKNRGNGEINGFYGSLYSDFQVENLYLGATCVGGVDFYDTSRHITISSNVYKAAAKYRALDIMAQFATAYFFGSPYAHFYPYANVDFLYLATPKVQESGAPGLNLTIHSRNDMTLRSEMGLGMQLQDANSDDTVCISPKISFGWVNISPIQRKLYSSHFESTTIDFETKGWDQVWNLLSLDFGLSLTIHSFSVGLKYNVEMSADAKTLLYNQHGDLNLSWSW